MHMKSISCFILEQRKSVLWGLVFLVVLAIISFFCFGRDETNKLWNDYLNTLFCFATLMVALAVWFGEAHEDWKAALPCKLTAIFIYETKEVIRCNHADLSSEGDMRALGQSIGSQMCNGSQLSIKMPEIQRTSGELETDSDGNVFHHYTILFTLRELPKGTQLGKVLLWKPPFELDPQLVEAHQA